MSDFTTLRVSTIDRDLIEVLRKRDGISSQIKYVNAMVNYFNSTGLNPEEKVKSTAGELSKLRNTVVSFTRRQENEKLDPMMKNIDELTNTLLTFLKNDALRKSEFIQYMESQNTSKSSEEIPQNNNQIAKELFNEFVDKMSSKIGGSFSIDKKTLMHYKNQFNAI